MASATLSTMLVHLDNTTARPILHAKDMVFSTTHFFVFAPLTGPFAQPT
jgi:hypothetical protein